MVTEYVWAHTDCKVSVASQNLQCIGVRRLLKVFVVHFKYLFHQHRQTDSIFYHTYEPQLCQLRPVRASKLFEIVGTDLSQAGCPSHRPTNKTRTTNVLWIRNCQTMLRMRRADASCALTRWQHFSTWNDVMGTILKGWRQTENLPPSIDAHLLEEHSCQISSRSDLKRRSLGYFEEGRHNRKKNELNI